VFDYGGNDSLAYKTNYFDFRGEKGRDKSKDISPLRFTMSNFKTAEKRAYDTQQATLKGVFLEKYHAKEEGLNQRMRPVAKERTSPVGF
jgi:hypothetical protein|tara:strand:- start:32 stop:298 length:267 start_codon:yes stop_codon:yes gene_type:complete